MEYQRPRTVLRPIAALGLALGLLVCITVSMTGAQSDHEPLNRELHRHHAETHLELAKTTLRRAELYNRKAADWARPLIAVSGADQQAQIAARRQLSNTTIERLKSNVTVAEERLKQVELASSGGMEELLRRYAGEKLRLAQLRLDTVLAKPEPQRDPLEAKQAQLQHRLAEIEAQMLETPKQLPSVVESLYWRTNQLAREFIQLEQRVADLEDRSKRQLAP